jgi:putative peptidoglycan lipid II flippase
MIQLIIGGIVQSITTVIYPKITSAIHEGEYKKAVSVFNTIANLLMYILIPMTFGIALFGRPIISILFERGEFDESALSMTSEAFIFYGLGLCFIGIRELLTRVFYSCEDTKTPMVNSSIGLVLNVILNILLSQWIGLNGLAIATSISAFVTAILLWVKMKKNQNLKNANISFVELVKIVGASVGMGAGAYCLYRYVFAESAIGAIIGIFSGVVLYIVLSFVLRIRVVKDAIGLIRRKK